MEMNKRKTAHVDRTKPSTACEPCRKRRAKCDRRRPQCSQCIRSGNTCSGYRSNLDLVMRNENEKVFKAVQKKAFSISEPAVKSVFAATQRDLDLPGEMPTSANSWARAAELANRNYVPLILQHAMGGVAVNYFVTHFGHGVYLDWLPTLFKTSRRSPMLEASLEAVGILYLGLRENRPELTQTAASKYSVALREISEALAESSRAVEDDTIASVLLVALFAAWSSPASEAARTWTYHINGAMALLDMRSDQTFNGYVIQWLLGHVIGAIQLDCINRWTSLPPQLAKLCKLSVQGHWDFQVHFWMLIQDLARFRELIALNQADDMYILYQATSLDAQAMRLLRIMPLPLEIEPIPDPHRIELKDCPVHIPAHRIVQARNTLRLIRLDVNKFILERCEKHFDHTLDVKATENIRTVIEEICESVPEFLRTTNNKMPLREDTNIWICSLLYALTFAVSSDVVAEDLKDRLRRQLEIFAEATDMQHLAEAATQVALGERVPEGLHIFYIC